MIRDLTDTKAMKAECERYASLLGDSATGVISYWCALDNYEPVTRKHAYGHAVTYVHPITGNKGIWVPVGPIPASKLEGSGIILDSGTEISAWWAGGYHDHPSSTYRDTENMDGWPYVLFHEFPLSVGIRPDNGRPVDMSSWMLGPRTFYHLKLT